MTLPQQEKYQQYMKIAYGLIVVFGIVGNVTGHRTASVMIFIIASTLWCCTRILEEAYVAVRSMLQPPSDPPNPPAPASVPSRRPSPREQPHNAPSM